MVAKVIKIALWMLIPGMLCAQQLKEVTGKDVYDSTVVCGDAQLDMYLPLLKSKRVGVVANHSAVVKGQHLVDLLISKGIKVKTVFAPEHGFRGKADAGEVLNDDKDTETGLPVISLYGEHKKPTAKELSNLDVLVYDIQDVGVRYYTYISTLHYVMESCAASGKAFVVLDRPNPNGYYVDGPVMEKKYMSFVGVDPLPLVYGMTVGELAKMINGEGWLGQDLKCDLTVIPCKGWNHKLYYHLPQKPSPNLPDMASVYLYPSLGLFEGTVISVGRGTDQPFKCFGHPDLDTGDFYFTPEPQPGAGNPPYKGEQCRGYDLSLFGSMMIRNYRRMYLFWLIGAYQHYPDKAHFFVSDGFFDLLAGTDRLRKQIQAGTDEVSIRSSWKPALDAFMVKRKKYLLYPDFH